jgi:hypothetical protein
VELTDLDEAILDRQHMQVCPYGPLTQAEQNSVDAYEFFMMEEEKEHDAFMRAGQRSVCPKCGKRAVKHGSAITLGYAGHPGAESSATEECENCDYRDLA